MKYDCPRRAVADFLLEKQKKNPRFSLRQFAKKLNLSHTLLVLLLRGKRPFLPRHVPTFATGMKLSQRNRLYFKALIQLQSTQDPDERKLCSEWISELRPPKAIRIREIDEFMLISDWLHMATMAATQLHSQGLTAEAIHRRLKHRVTRQQVHSAVERLLSMGLLKKSLDERLQVTEESVSSREDVANAGARLYHKNVLDLVKESLDKQAIELREAQSFTLCIPREQISEAKKMIRHFRQQLAVKLAPGHGDEVYQFTLQMFPLTEASELAPPKATKV